MGLGVHGYAVLHSGFIARRKYGGDLHFVHSCRDQPRLGHNSSMCDSRIEGTHADWGLHGLGC